MQCAHVGHFVGVELPPRNNPATQRVQLLLRCHGKLSVVGGVAKFGAAVASVI